MSRVRRELEEIIRRKPLELHASLPIQDARIEENRLKLTRITRAIEEGAPAETFLGRIRELEDEHQALLRQKQDIEQLATELDQLQDVEEAVARFAREFLSSFGQKPLHEKRDLVRRTVSRIIFDHPGRVIRCYLRKIPLASAKVKRILEERGAIKSKTAPGDQMPFRIKGVAGTRTFDSAKIYRSFLEEV